MEALYDKVMDILILWVERKFFANLGTMLVSQKIFQNEHVNKDLRFLYNLELYWLHTAQSCLRC